MTLLSPWWLLSLVPVVGLAAAYVLVQRRRQRYAVRFATLPMMERLAPAKPGWRRHAPAGALLLAMVSLGLASARPEAEVRVPHERATVIVAVDVSQSMQATDVSPNRLEAAKSAAAAFVEELPDTFNVGVVTFSGTTSVLAAPTTDHADVAARLQTLEMADSTAIGEAVFTSLDQVAAQATGGEEVPARIVLLSDGSNTQGRDPEQAATAATEAGVPVSTIAYGTPDGSIEMGGRSVTVPVDEETLAALADQTGGQAYTAQSGEELAAVYDDIGSSIGWRTEDREITPYVAAGALLLAMAGAAMSLRWSNRLP